MAAGSNSFCRTLSLGAHPRNLRQVRRFVEEVSADLGLSDEDAYDLKVAVSEAAANAVEHSGAAAHVEVCARRFPDRLTIEITDGGDFRLAASRSEPATSRGLGLPLMVALMDEVRIYKSPDKGTTVALSLFVTNPA